MINKIYILILICTIQILAGSKDVIKGKIEQILSKIPATARAGVLIYNPLTQDTVYQLNPTQSMIPASNTKMFTTATALNLMGGDFTLATKLLTDDNNYRDGVINGNLYIKGYGNSVLTISDLNNMVQELKSLGITKIMGNIIGDDTYFDSVYTRDDWINDEVANVKLPPISAIVIDRNRTITQVKRRKRIRTVLTNISNPPLHAAMLLKEKLINNGIDVFQGVSTGVTPQGAIPIAEKKIILRDLISLINKHSDNFLAECLFKTIGAVSSGIQGNAFYSTQTILSFIDDNNIYSTGTSIVDGSGISRFNHITTGAIAGLLEKMYFDLKNFEDYYNSFSIAGVDGTLRRRMIGSSAENNFHGKTGTLNGVSSIAGYVTSKNDEDFVISIIFEYNKGGASFYRNIEDEIIETLADWN